MASQRLLHTLTRSRFSSRSALLATVSAGVIVGAGASWALRPERAWLARRAIGWVYALPGTLVALGWVLTAALGLRLVILDRVTLVLALQGSVWLLGVVADVSKYLSAGIENADAAFSRVAPSLVEAARLSGAVEQTNGTSRLARASYDRGREIQDVGGYINAYTSFDRTVFWIDVPKDGVTTALDILSDAMMNSTLPPEEYQKDR